MMIKNLNALGLFGGASLNSVELALLNTDGIDIKEIKKNAVVPYPDALAADIRTIIAKRVVDLEELKANSDVQRLNILISDFYAETISDFAEGEDIEAVGIDSLTICNDPPHKCSYQVEKGDRICHALGRNIVTHFHKADLLSGGQASPLTPAFFNAVGQDIIKPALFIDLEAVCSLIYLGESGELQAFDCAPGLAMIEDWTFRHANMQTDYNGRLAITGNVHPEIINMLLHHKFLSKMPPKSLDIMCFSDKKEHLEGLSLEDGAATATSFIAKAIKQAADDFLPEIPQEIYVSGEGLKNPSLLRFLKQTFAPYDVKSIYEINPQLNALGAQATAFNTVRRIYSLPITFPTTTGAYEPMTGGEIYEKI